MFSYKKKIFYLKQKSLIILHVFVLSGLFIRVFIRSGNSLPNFLPGRLLGFLPKIVPDFLPESLSKILPELYLSVLPRALPESYPDTYLIGLAQPYPSAYSTG
jgi:hypothetical protein